jgi:hypothetical protein
MSHPNPGSRNPPLYRSDGLLDTLADYIQTKSGAAQLRQQNLEEEKQRQEEYQRRVEADVVGVEPYSLFFGRATQDPSVGFQLAPADLWPGTAAAKAGLLSAAAIPVGMWARHAWKSAPTPGTLGAFGYHGTPHRWESVPGAPLGKPDISKVGTGEGAQAYGHGFYVSEQPGVARTYKDYLTDAATRFVDKEGIGFKPYTVFNTIAKSVYRVGGATKNNAEEIAYQVLAKMRRGDSLVDFEKAVLQSDVFDTNIKQRYLAAIETAKKYRTVKSEGSLYKFDIPDADIDKMLDWDAPLKGQGQYVARLAHKYGVADTADGGTLVEVMNRRLGSKRASQVLNSSGIPGIKYYDQQSRGFVTRLQASTAGATPEALEKATRNFVIFDEDLLNRIKVLERN